MTDIVLFIAGITAIIAAVMFTSRKESNLRPVPVRSRRTGTRRSR